MKGIIIRDKPQCVSFKVDDIINQLIENTKNTKFKTDWLERQKDHVKAQQERQVGELDIDSQVDVRDTNHIWCEGKVGLIIEQMNKDTLYVIHYEGKPASEDEVIQKTSERLAMHGHFSSRPEIPRWQMIKNKENVKVPVIRNQILSVYSLLLMQQAQLARSSSTSLDKFIGSGSISNHYNHKDNNVVQG